MNQIKIRTYDPDKKLVFENAKMNEYYNNPANFKYELVPYSDFKEWKRDESI